MAHPRFEHLNILLQFQIQLEHYFEHVKASVLKFKTNIIDLVNMVHVALMHFQAYQIFNSINQYIPGQTLLRFTYYFFVVAIIVPFELLNGFSTDILIKELNLQTNITAKKCDLENRLAYLQHYQTVAFQEQERRRAFLRKLDLDEEQAKRSHQFDMQLIQNRHQMDLLKRSQFHLQLLAELKIQLSEQELEQRMQEIHVQEETWKDSQITERYTAWLEAVVKTIGAVTQPIKDTKRHSTTGMMSGETTEEEHVRVLLEGRNSADILRFLDNMKYRNENERKEIT